MSLHAQVRPNNGLSSYLILQAKDFLLFYYQRKPKENRSLCMVIQIHAETGLIESYLLIL